MNTKYTFGILGLLVILLLGGWVLKGNGDKDVSFNGAGLEFKAATKNPTDNKAISVDPRLPGNSPVPGISIKKGQSVEVIPARDFKWSCKGNVNIVDEFVGPGGNGFFDKGDKRHLLPNAPFCGLIGRVGTGAWQYLGGDKNAFISDSSGSLYLTANDVTPENCRLPDKSECYSDNRGDTSATVTVNVGK
jgi:hypothetical protein